MSGGTAPVYSDKKRHVPSADDVEYLLENDVIDIDTLKQFTIPKKKSHNHDVFTRIDMTTPEARELIRVIHQSFKERDSIDCFVFSRPRIVNNAHLLEKFTDRKKQMKHNGYSEKELQEIFAFLYFSDDAKAVKVCSEGIFTNNSNITCLGDPKMGVYLSKHADLISPKPLKNKMFGTILIVKVIKGRVKLMSDCVSGMILDPSPNFDCHILKSSSMDISSSSLQHIFECTQLYLYEYMEDSELSTMPSQLLPYALLNFRYERSGRSLPLLATPSIKQSKVERKSGLHVSSEKKSKSQGNVIKEGESNANQKLTTILCNDYQLWSGNVYASEISLGFCLLNSSCIFIDATFLGHDIYIREKVPLEYLKTAILKNAILSLDDKKENIVEDVCIAVASLHPSFPNTTFNSFVEHLLQTSMAGYVALLDCTEIFLVPSEALKDCASLSNGSEKHALHCFFISKHAAFSRLQGYLEQKLAMNFSRMNPFFNADIDHQGSSISDHPASPEQESPSAKVRDPRLRYKVKSNKSELESNIKQRSIIGSSRLLSLFEHMSDIQEKMNVEISHGSNHGNRGNFSYSEQAKQESGSLQQFLVKPELKTGEPSMPEACANLTSPSSTPNANQNAVLTTFDDPINQQKLPQFKIPETVYATAIADPKVNQLLEELKSKNIIGLGLSALPEVSSSRSVDAGPKLDGYEAQKQPGRTDPRLEKLSKRGDCEAGFSGRGPNQIYEPQNQLFSPDCSRVDGFYPRDSVQSPEERFNNLPQTHMRPYSPGDIGGRSPQFSDQRRRYGSFLPDPKTFQKKFIDTHHQRPPNPYPNKPDSRMNRSRFSRQQPGGR